MVNDPKVQLVFLGCKSTNPNCTVSDSGPIVFASLMNNSQEDPTMPYVTQGDPLRSYLLYKLEGSAGGVRPNCIAVSVDPIVKNASGEPQPLQPCGASMPLGGGGLPDFTSKVRAWIIRGALQN
ncbi:MAG: hypothetical protein M3O46_23675 [Myxococcota bacterium]|nr:hypothetical protein [Myxococcota bacterium]